MRESRARVPPKFATYRRPSPLRFRLRVMKRRLLRAVGRDEKRVKIVAGQTAELRMIPSRDGSRREPLVFSCPICTERDHVDTKLLMMELKTDARRPGSRSQRDVRRRRHVLMLVRVTRQQIEDIRDEFNRPPTPPRPQRTGREMVLGSLVP